MPTRLVFATRNQGKLHELRTLVGDLPLNVVGIDDTGVPFDVVEDGQTFFDNARKKAKAALELTGLPALADDSGLEVEALGGAPGVYSARYAGEPSSDARNNARLLEALEGVPAPRSACFRCVLALARPGHPVVFTEGACEGSIGFAPRGDGGFGYDPLFVVAGDGRTMAELGLAEKNAVSHRGRAMRRMATVLRAWLRPGG